MILEELVSKLDNIFKKKTAEGWDRVGLQVGREKNDIRKILVTLDIDDWTIKEAVSCKADLIISHHPLIFNPIDSVTYSGNRGRKIIKLLENGISTYSAHSNYDIMTGGLNDIIAEKLGLKEVKNIKDYKEKWYKFAVFVPAESQEKIRKAICKNSGGDFKNYSCCTFSSRGSGTFIPGRDAAPYTGNTGELSIVDEVRMECIVSEENLKQLVEAVVKEHPYEEPAYDIYSLENKSVGAGLGKYGRIDPPATFKDYLKFMKKKLQITDAGWLDRGIENTGNRIIEKVAVLGGSANSISECLKEIDCGLIITGEIGYHDAIDISEGGKIVVVIGHGSSEKFAIDGIYGKLIDYFRVNNINIDVSRTKSGYWTWRYNFV
jgi:dinuclear metal center YbgI/SA1388 family protein